MVCEFDGWGVSIFIVDNRICASLRDDYFKAVKGYSKNMLFCYPFWGDCWLAWHTAPQENFPEFWILCWCFLVLFFCFGICFTTKSHFCGSPLTLVGDFFVVGGSAFPVSDSHLPVSDSALPVSDSAFFVSDSAFSCF